MSVLHFEKYEQKYITVPWTKASIKQLFKIKNNLTFYLRKLLHLYISLNLWSIKFSNASESS